MGRQAIYDAMCIRPEDEPSMTAFIASAGRRTYGKAIRDEAGALGYSLPATMPNDPYSLAAISDLAAHHAASIRAGYNPRLARAINALPDGTTDDQVRHLLQPFIDSTRIYNTDTLYPLLNARLRALGIGHFYDRNGIKSQYRIMPDESDYDDDCQADIDLGIVDSLDDFSRTDYPWHPHCGHMGEPHMIVRVNIDPQTLPAPEELWDSTQGPVKSIIVIKEFDESQHPRDEHGRFSDSGGGANGSLSSLMPLHPSTVPGVTMIQERSAADNYTQWAFSELVSDPPNNADTNLDNERGQYFQAMQDAESRDDYHTYVFAALSAPALDEGEESEHEQGLWEELRTMQADTVAGRIRSDGEQFSTETAQRFMDQWSESAVSTEYSQSLQHAAADRWSVPVTPMVEEHGEWHDPILDQEAARFLNAQYDLTQEWYSAYPQTTQRGENGDRYVYLYRGMSFRPDSIPSALQSVGEHMSSEGEPWDEINIRQNPLSSWTSIIGTAQDFARAQEQAGLQGYILAARAPTSRILGNGITGIGAIREGEHVVIGGLDKVTATRIG